MVQTTSTPDISPDDLKMQIRKLNSKAGQLKMDLHDLAEGLPTDYEKLMDVAGETYAIFHQIAQMRQQLAILKGDKAS